MNRLITAHRTLAERMPLADLTRLTVEVERAAVNTEDPSERTSPLTREPLASSSEVSAARIENMRRSFAERHRLLRDTATVGEVAAMLGVGRQTPHDRRNAGTLVGIKANGHWRFPLWQFDPDGSGGVVDGLPDVIKALRAPLSDLGRIRWFVTRKPLLDGRTPIDALRDGDVDEVLEEAEALGAS